MLNSGSLAESFLEDLDELGEGSGEEEDDNILGDDLGAENDEEDDDLDAVLGKIASAKGISNITGLRSSNNFKNHMDAIWKSLNSPPVSEIKLFEDDPEYKLLVESNSMIHAIDEEIGNIHRYVAELYAKKFPELEALVPNKIDYIKTVKRIGNEMDMTMVDLNDLLPSASVMVVSVTGSTTSGQVLSESDLKECFKGCDEVLELSENKATILKYVESRMTHVAPNLCAIIGSRVTALLIGMAGGLLNLTKIPSCNLQVMGQERRHLAGYSNISAMPHIGIIYQCDLVQNCPPGLRKKALKVVAGKVVLAARVDCFNHTSGSSGSTGGEGQKMRLGLEETIEKWLEPPKAQTKKALPVPEEKKRNKRGGKRVRRWKERFAMTDVRAEHNKIVFSDKVGEYGDSAMGFDNVEAQRELSGKVRAPQKKEVKLLNNNKKQKKISLSSGQTNGLSSSLVFTPVQGLELVNPNAAAEKVREANRKWFDASSGFLSAAPK